MLSKLDRALRFLNCIRKEPVSNFSRNVGYSVGFYCGVLIKRHKSLLNIVYCECGASGGVVG
jgi:hypothetical protein